MSRCCIRRSLNIVQHLAQCQLQRLHSIRVVCRCAPARVVRQLQRSRPRRRRHSPWSVQSTTRIGNVVYDASCVPGRRVEHHAHGRFTRFSTRFSRWIRICRALAQGPIRATVAPTRGRASLSTGDPTADAPNLFDIVNAVGLLLEEKLIKMATERRRCKCLVTVLAFAILGCLVVHRFRGRLGVVVTARLFRRLSGSFFFHVGTGLRVGEGRGAAWIKDRLSIQACTSMTYSNRARATGSRRKNWGRWLKRGGAKLFGAERRGPHESGATLFYTILRFLLPGWAINLFLLEIYV